MKLTLSDLSGRDSSEEKLPKLSESFAVSLTSRRSAGGIVSLEAFCPETFNSKSSKAMLLLSFSSSPSSVRH